MTDPDTYLTIKGFSQGIYREKGSRFIALAYPVTSVDEIKMIIDHVKKEYNDARHHCYAFSLGKNKEIWRFSDDGEPSGTAGKPIMGQINSKNLTNILIIVVRYFGGKLLGTSGLINAYKTAAASAIANSVILEKYVLDNYRLEFPYLSMNDVMKVIKEEELIQYDQKFEELCKLTVSFRNSKKEKVLNALSRIKGLKYEFVNSI